MKWKHPFPARALIAGVEKREREALEDPKIMYESMLGDSECAFRGYETISGVFECPNGDQIAHSESPKASTGDQMARSECPKASTGDQMAHSESPKAQMVTRLHFQSLRGPKW